MNVRVDFITIHAMNRIYTAGNNSDNVLGVYSKENVITQPELVLFSRELEIIQVCTGDEFSVALTRT